MGVYNPSGSGNAHSTQIISGGKMAGKKPSKGAPGKAAKKAAKSASMVPAKAGAATTKRGKATTVASKRQRLATSQGKPKGLTKTDDGF